MGVTSRLPRCGTNMQNSSPVASSKGRDSHVYGSCGNLPTDWREVPLLEPSRSVTYRPLNEGTRWFFPAPCVPLVSVVQNGALSQMHLPLVYLRSSSKDEEVLMSCERRKKQITARLWGLHFSQ